MTAERGLAAVPEDHEPSPDDVGRVAGRRPARPSATRNASLSRANHVRELRRGNANGMRHGLFAEVAYRPQIQTEVALTFVARPGLDPIRDLRLVESYAMAQIHLRRAHVLIEEQGLTELLSSFVSKAHPIVERLERQIADTERRNLAERGRAGDDRLARYRSRATP